MRTPLVPICLDIDGSIAGYASLRGDFAEIAPLRALEQLLRVRASEQAMRALCDVIVDLRQRRPGPWLTCIGSGDLHHVTELLLATLPAAEEPITVVVIDNHPDWFRTPRYHCGTWVSAILALASIEKVVLAGQNCASDLRGIDFRSAPFGALCSGQVEIHPYRKASARVPFRYPAAVCGAAAARRRWYGVELEFDTVAVHGVEPFFDRLSRRLQHKQVYLSLDLDCLTSADIDTDWEPGAIRSDDLVAAVRHIASRCKMVGADIVGEQAPARLQGFTKRFSAGRLFERGRAAALGGRGERIVKALVGALTETEPRRR